MNTSVGKHLINTRKYTSLPGCVSCSRNTKKEVCFVPPILGDTDGRLDLVIIDANKRIKDYCKNLDLNVSYLLSAQCEIDEKPDIGVIKNCREAYIQPILNTIPDTVPVICLGDYAASSILGGRRSASEGAGKVRVIQGRKVYFSYSPDDITKLSHIKIVIQSALAEWNKQVVYWTTDLIPSEFWESKYIYFDIETENDTEFTKRFSTAELKKIGPLHFRYGTKVLLAGLANEISDVVYILTPENIETVLKRGFKNYKGTLIGHNLNFDASYLKFLGITLPLMEDTLLRRKTKEKRTLRGNDLKWLAKEEFHLHGYEAIVHSLWDEKKTPEFKDLAEYNAYDVITTKSLHQEYMKTQDNDNAYSLACAYLDPIIGMENNGIFVDLPELRKIKKDIEFQRNLVFTQLNAMTSAFQADFNKYNKSGLSFNYNSWQQVLKFLKNEGVCINGTSEEILEENQDKHQFIPLLLKLRALDNVYLKKLATYEKWVHPKTGLIHSTFGVVGTETGRCNSSNPNLQNVPKEVRVIFKPRFSFGRFVLADLKGLEYRLIAHLSDDSDLISIFNNPNRNIHNYAASIVFGEEEVLGKNKSKNYKLAKTANYVSCYGGGEKKFYQAIGEVNTKAWNQTKLLYPKVRHWKDRIIRELHHTGYAVNIFGRKRWFGKNCDQNDEREAINWIIQSSGHSILKIIILTLTRMFESLFIPALLVHEGHDSMIFDCPQNWSKTCRQEIEKLDINKLIEKELLVKMKIPILLEIEESLTWK